MAAALSNATEGRVPELVLGVIAAVLVVLGVGWSTWRHRHRPKLRMAQFDSALSPSAERASAVELRDLVTGAAEHVVKAQPCAAGHDGGVEDSRFACDARALVTGRPEAAALGIIHLLGVSSTELYASLSDATAAIVDEVERCGSTEARECLHYVLHEAAGSSPTLFSNSPFPRDCDADGVRVDRQRTDGTGVRLADFVAHPSARGAKLEEAHVVALRLYSTAAFRDINMPLRQMVVTEAGRQSTERRSTAGEGARRPTHPLPVTVFCIAEGIRRLRAIDAGSPNANTSLDVWRGLQGVLITDAFLERGGTELAPMSTSKELDVAMQYAFGGSSLIFKLSTASFMERGADISVLSAFPAEAEPQRLRVLMRGSR